MKIKACMVCGSRKLVMLQLPSERETHPHSDFLDNTFPVKYLCGDCANIDEVFLFNSEEDWKKYLEIKKKGL